MVSSELLLIEMTVALGSLLLGWLHLRQNRLEQRLDNCVEKDAVEEMREDMKRMVEIVTALRVENAKWQGLMQRALENE